MNAFVSNRVASARPFVAARPALLAGQTLRRDPCKQALGEQHVELHPSCSQHSAQLSSGQVDQNESLHAIYVDRYVDEDRDDVGRRGHETSHRRASLLRCLVLSHVLRYPE